MNKGQEGVTRQMKRKEYFKHALQTGRFKKLKISKSSSG